MTTTRSMTTMLAVAGRIEIARRRIETAANTMTTTKKIMIMIRVAYPVISQEIDNRGEAAGTIKHLYFRFVL